VAGTQCKIRSSLFVHGHVEYTNNVTRYRHSRRRSRYTEYPSIEILLLTHLTSLYAFTSLLVLTTTRAAITQYIPLSYTEQATAASQPHAKQSCPSMYRLLNKLHEPSRYQTTNAICTTHTSTVDPTNLNRRRTTHPLSSSRAIRKKRNPIYPSRPFLLHLTIAQFRHFPLTGI
jgi:hypothetical protein